MLNVASKIKAIKADRLISITSVKKDGKNTLYYHFSWNKKPEIKQFSIEVPQGEKVESLIGVFPNAVILEAELTELFRVKFVGNPLSGKRVFQAEGHAEEAKCAFDNPRGPKVK